MDGYTYVNIFETKGIEYLAIIAFLVLLIPFWIYLNRQVHVAYEFRRAFNLMYEKIKKIPYGLFYSASHTWAYLEKAGAARVGIDDLLLQVAGNTHINFIRKPDEKISKGDLLAEIGQNGRTLKIYSPISGMIQDTNLLLDENPEMIGEDPYGKGWICKIKPTQWKEETTACYLAEDASDWLSGEVQRFKDFLAVRANKLSNDGSMVVLQDGGEINDEILSYLPDEVWQDFQKEFLDPGK